MSDALTPESLAELRRLAENATPGPWVSGDHMFGDGNAQCIVSISERAMGRDVQGPTLRPALFDVEFIAAANPAAVLDLLNQLDAAEARLEAVRALAVNPYPDARNISGTEILRAIEGARVGPLLVDLLPTVEEFAAILIAADPQNDGLNHVSDLSENDRNYYRRTARKILGIITDRLTTSSSEIYRKRRFGGS